MAHYEYKGQHFELPDGLDNDAALNKIKAHLGETVKKSVDTMKAPTYMGIPEAAVSMVAGIPSQVAGGLMGLGTLLSGQGLDKAADTSARIQEENFGFGRFEGITDPGKRATKKAGEIMAMPGQAAGEYIGAPIGKALGNEELGRLSAQLPVDVALNFLPLHFGVNKPLLAGANLVDKLTTPKDKPTSQIKAGLDEYQKSVETPAPVVTDPGAQAIQNITDSQITGWQEPVRNNGTGNGIDAVVSQLEQQRLAETQRILDERQKQMEFEVAQRASLDRNAAERARQEQAPTGRDAWVEQQRMAAEQRRPGDNTPLDFENLYPVKADDYPNVMQDAPYQYEGGIDYTLPRDKAALPIEVADILRTGERTPDPFNRYSPNQAARRILEEGETPPIIKTNRRGGMESGAIDITVFNDAIEKLRPLVSDEIISRLLTNPEWKDRSRLVLMPVDDFLSQAKSGGSEMKQAGVGDWFGKKKMHSEPTLWYTKDKDGQDAVVGHEGRHRARAFKQAGLEYIPVKITSDRIRWSEQNNPDAFDYRKDYPNTLLTEQGQTTQFPIPRNEATLPNAGKFNQRGGLDFQEIGKALGNFRKRFGTPEDSLATPISPEMIAAKQEQRVKAEKAASIVGEKLPEYFDPQTFEEVVTLARDAKDIKSNPYSRGTAPGNNFMATYHNNPLLKYMRKVIGDARGAASAFSREYVTGENGVSPAIVKLNSKEKVQVAELLTELDKRQIDWNPEMSAKLGLSDNISNYMTAHQKAMDAQWDWHLKNTGDQGLNIARKRRGYSPSVFEGQYNALVMQDGRPVGVIAVDSPGEFMKAKEYYSKKYPTSKFSADTWQQARRSFSGGASSAFKYRDLGAMIDLLAKADGDFAKVQMKVDQEILRASTDLFNFNVHNLAKSNVEGNLGNKGWMSPEKNAQQRLDSVVKFLEEAAEHHSLQKPMEELRLLMADDSTKNLTNTKEYMDDYMKNISGSYLNNAGKVINAAFDGLHKGLVESVAAHIPGVRNYVGPGNTLKVSNFIKNKMSQMYMGWFNWTFTASQFMQPVQTGAPMLEMVAGRLGLPVADAAKSLSVGGGDFVKVQLHRMGLIDNLDPRIADAVDWAEKRGLLDFTELERAYEGNKTRVGRALDKAAEVNMKIGENGTRPPMFLAFIDMVSKVEPNKTRAYEIAENLTNQAMADYHKYERPLMYTGMGVLSPHVGGLTTFKHNYTGTQVLLGKEALKPGLRSKAPLAMSAMTMLMLGGITGTMFYNEFNTIYEYLREKYSGEKRSIAQDMLQAMPQYAKTGIISSILDLNMQGKFSSADMVPDTFAKAAFPHLSGAYDIAAAGYDAARNPNENTLGNFAVAATPSGMKQASKYAFKSDEEGNLINKYGQVESPRTEEEWKRSIISGLVPLGEANKSQALYQNRKNEKARMERMTKLSQDFKAAVLAGEDPDKLAEILNAYEEVGGLGQSLVSQIPKIHQEAQKTAQERAEGVPSSRAAIRRYEAYQN